MGPDERIEPTLERVFAEKLMEEVEDEREPTVALPEMRAFPIMFSAALSFDVFVPIFMLDVTYITELRSGVSTISPVELVAWTLRPPSSSLRDNRVPPIFNVFPERNKSLKRKSDEPRSNTLHCVGSIDEATLIWFVGPEMAPVT